MNKTTIPHYLLKWIWVTAGIIVLALVVFTIGRHYYLRGVTEVSGYRVSRVVAEATQAYAAGNLSEAKSIYQEWLKGHPNDAFVWNGLANIYRDNHDYPGAEAAYLRAIGADPHFVQGYRNLYTLYALWSADAPDQLHKAESVLLRGWKDNPKSITILEDIVSYYNKVGNSVAVDEYNVSLNQLKQDI